MEKTTNNNALVPTDFSAYLQTVEPVPEETIAEVVHDADGVVSWIKYNDSGFTINDTVIPSLQGPITHVHPHFARWENEQVEKLDSLDELDEDEAKGFERRCDIHVMTTAGLLVGISMPKTSYYQRFAPYVKMLDEKGLNPSDVVTEITVGQRRNAFGTYNILNFKPVKFLKELADADPIPF